MRIGRGIMRAIIEDQAYQGHRGRGESAISAGQGQRPSSASTSVHGRFNGEVKVGGDTIDVGRGKMKVTAQHATSNCVLRRWASSTPQPFTGFFTSKIVVGFRKRGSDPFDLASSGMTVASRW